MKYLPGILLIALATVGCNDASRSTTVADVVAAMEA